MGLIIVWVGFTIAIARLKLKHLKYILFSLILLVLTYIYNIIFPTRISLRHAIFISIIPNSCIWYLAFKCNDFLWVFPYNWHSFMAVFLIYSYILIYIVCESYK